MKILAALAVALQASAGLPDAAIQCPALPPHSGLTWSYQEGPDFGVCYAADSGTRTNAFGLYLGFAPSFRPDPSKHHTQGVVGGRQVQWYRRDPGSGSSEFSQEALVNLDQGEVAHVWVRATSESELAKRLAILAKLQFK